jgi:peptidyl-prolyl cis-trans isomerase C
MRRIGLVLLLAVAACQRPSDDGSHTVPASAEPPGETIATYEGKTLGSRQVMDELERLPAPSRAYLASAERKRQFVENMILNDLLYEEGRKSGWDRDPDIERQVTDLRKRLVVQRVMRQYQTPPTVTDEQARAYYDESPDLYSTTQIRASHILVKDEQTAKDIAASVKAHPERFADLAREKSVDTASAQKGGELGMFGQGRMVPEFEKAAFALRPGEVSDVVKTQYGYHVITVTERKEGERRPFEQVKEQIRAMLRNKMTQDRVQSHYESLKKNADVKIDDAALARVNPPPPQGGGEMQHPPIH